MNRNSIEVGSARSSLTHHFREFGFDDQPVPETGNYLKIL
jgi:hypothetical protein